MLVELVALEELVLCGRINWCYVSFLASGGSWQSSVSHAASLCDNLYALSSSNKDTNPVMVFILTNHIFIDPVSKEVRL